MDLAVGEECFPDLQEITNILRGQEELRMVPQTDYLFILMGSGIVCDGITIIFQ